MSVEFDRGSPGKFDSRTLNRKTPNRWTGRNRRGLWSDIHGVCLRVKLYSRHRVLTSADFGLT